MILRFIKSVFAAVSLSSRKIVLSQSVKCMSLKNEPKIARARLTVSNSDELR